MTEPVFFDAPDWSAELTYLQQVVGAGRLGQIDGLSLRLTIRAVHALPALLPIELSVESRPVCAWVDATALLEWLEPSLPIPDLPPPGDKLREAAAACMLAPWFDWCSANGLTPPLLKVLGGPALPPEVLSIVLSFIADIDHGSRWLNLYLDDFPSTWVRAMAERMTAAPVSEATEHNVTLAGCAGLARLSVAQLTTLRIGDVVMATRQAMLEDGSLLLALGRRLVQIRRINENHFRVECIMELLNGDTDLMSDTTQLAPESTVADLSMTCVFEIGRMTLPLSKLAQLQVGDVLETNFTATPEVGIRAQGRLIATASLVRIGDRLGARICSMIDAAPDMPVFPESVQELTA